MTTYESAIKTLNCADCDAYAIISDLRNLEQIKDRIPKDKIKAMSFDEESCSITVDPVGEVIFRIVEKEPYKTVKFGADKSPIAFNVWIQLKQIEANDTKLKITFKADLPFMIKSMVGGKIEQFVNTAADMLASAINSKFA